VNQIERLWFKKPGLLSIDLVESLPPFLSLLCELLVYLSLSITRIPDCPPHSFNLKGLYRLEA
jgi:hypothetical protein